MSEKSKKTKSHRVGNFHDARKHFRRTIHSVTVLRGGLGKARNLVEARHIPAIVEDLARQPFYFNLLVGEPFPKTLSFFKDRKRLVRAEGEKEFIWAASVLSLFKTELTSFLQYRLNFESEFVQGNYARAHAILDAIEEKHGVSIWLIANRLQTLQLSAGVNAQKDYLEQIVNIDGLHSLVVFFACFFSLRSEEHVSLASLESEVEHIIKMPGLGDYAVYHINPYDLTRIRDASIPIEWEEPHPIIDRFQAFVAMAQLQMVREQPSKNKYLCDALRLIEPIGDPRVTRMLNLLRLSSIQPAHALSAIDAYTEGKYRQAASYTADLLELAARANVLIDEPRPSSSSSSIASQIMAAMSDVLLYSAEYQKAKTHLQKLALTCANQPDAIQIAAFLERGHEHIFVHDYSQLDLLAALSGAPDNPWSSAPFAKITGQAPRLDKLLLENGDSPTLQLQNILQFAFDEGISALGELALPDYRRAMYKGHLAFEHDRYDEATEHYRTVLKCGKPYMALKARLYLFKTLFAQEKLGECLSLVVDHYLENPTSVHLYPLGDLAQASIRKVELSASLPLAILLHVTAKHVNPKWESELSDVYENVLARAGVSRPTEIAQNVDLLGESRVIYFLRFICSHRILEDTTTFDDVTAIDDERIAICQFLIEVDPTNADAYSAEIRTITRGANITQLLQRVEESKIYVDEDGIRNVVENTLRDSFARYQRFLHTPSLNFQAEKISKRLEELLGDKAPPDLRNLKPPTSEREGLFTTMLSDFLTQFALNPAYGLDTHLSTTIRHGSFEGHVRSPLAAQELLCLHDGASNDYSMPERWEIYFSELDPHGRQYVRRQMGKFTSKVEDLIQKYRKELLQIRGTDTNVQGLFNYIVTPEERLQLMETITESTTYEDMVEGLIGFCWHLTDRSMDEIRRDLNGTFRMQINNALDALISSVESRISHDQVVVFTDAVVHARTEFQTSIDNICGWFRKPTDLRRDPFDFEWALGVALKQIENCYVNLYPVQNLNVQPKIPGIYLDGMVEILFILLQNIIRHSGFTETQAGVNIKAALVNSSLEIEITNELARYVDLVALTLSAHDAMGRYERDTALRMARSEGNSGLSKVWRILEFDFKKRHRLNLHVSEERTFQVTLRIDDIWVPT